MALDGTIVNVSLSAIRADLGFSAESLVWVVNVYLLSYAGFRLIGGRLGDIFGHRKIFLYAIALFTAASAGCAFANSRGFLIGARAVQGLGGALVMASALSLIMTMFRDTAERARAIGIYGFVGSVGVTSGLLLGGLITTALNWHWIFLINLPLGVLIYISSTRLIQDSGDLEVTGGLDIAGAITATASSILAFYAIINADETGWTSIQTLTLFAAAAALLLLFFAIEARSHAPLVPFRVFQMRNLVVCAVASVLVSVANSAGIFCSLYLQLVLRCSSLEVGFAFLPSSLAMGVFSLRVSALLVVRLGVRPPLVVGLLLAAAGLLLLAQAPVIGSIDVDVLPGTVLLGVGLSMAFNPLFLAATSGVDPNEAGLVSGIIGSSSMMGGALGLAVLASVAAARTKEQRAFGAPFTLALNNGYHAAFVIGALAAIAAATIGGTLLQTDQRARESVT